jgi:translocon-associated protein subunit beta
MLRSGLVVLLVCISALNADDGAARLLLSKQVYNKYVVEGMDVVVKYGLYNVGDSAATDIQVVDNGFRSDDFELVSGQTQFKLDRLSAQANMTQTVVVRPRKFGYFNFTAAEVTYSAGEGGIKLHGLSSEPGQAVIIAARDYDKQFSSHFLDWLAFAVMTLPSLAIPFALWWSSKSKYEAILNKKE